MLKNINKLNKEENMDKQKTKKVETKKQVSAID